MERPRILRNGFVRWVIDGISFTMTILLLLSAYSYTRGYINGKRIAEEGGPDIVNRLHAAAPALATYMEIGGKKSILFFIDFSCPKCVKFWNRVKEYEPALADRYTFILVPESTDVPVPVANIFIDRYGAVKRTLHVDSSPSMAVIDPVSYSIETVWMNHRIIEWLRRESSSGGANKTVSSKWKGGDGEKKVIGR